SDFEEIETEQDQENPESGSELGIESEELEEEFEETEYEGKKYKLPKELKSALLRQSDYTKKTQEVAEQRKAIDSERQSLQKIREAQTKEFEAYAEVHHLDKQLAEYSKVDWNKLIDEDPQYAMKLDQEFRALSHRRNQRLQEIHARETERSQKQQQEIAKLEEETRTTLSRDIKNWGTELQNALSDYAKS